MAITFSCAIPQLKLDAQLADIKHAILNCGSRTAITLTEQAVSHFAPHLEGNWGSLYDSLPAFFTQLIGGGWGAGEDQIVPTSLLGDFGEFLGYSAFARTCKAKPDLARVVRPSSQKRPDFLVFDPATQKITALECKAHAENALRIRRRARNKHVPLNLCSAIRLRRDDALEQVGSRAIIPQRAKADWYTVEKPKARYGVSRVAAHRTAVVTPLFIDGRLATALSGFSIAKPHGCHRSCATCLCPGEDTPTCVTPIFLNDSELIEPLLPDGFDLAHFMEAYAQLGNALWVGSQTLFSDSLSRVAHHILSSKHLRQAPIEYTMMLLDIMAAGYEHDNLTEPPTTLLKALGESLSTTDAGAVDAAVSLHKYEEDCASFSTPATPVLGSPQVSADDAGSESGPSRAARGFTAGPHLRELKQAPVGEDRRRARSVSTDEWTETYAGRLRRRDREVVKRVELGRSSDWASLRSYIDASPSHERVGTIIIDDDVIDVLRPPFAPGGWIELRVAGRTPASVHRAVKTMVGVLSRQTDVTSHHESHFVTAADRRVAGWEALSLRISGDRRDSIIGITGDGRVGRVLFSPEE